MAERPRKRKEEGRSPSKRGPKFTETELEGVIAEVAKLDRMGFPGYKIAQRVGVVPSMVTQYLKKIRRQYQEATVHSRAELVTEKLNLLKDIRQEAYDAYERSKEDARRVVERKVAPVRIKGKKQDGDDTPEPSPREMLVAEIVATVEGRLPANQYLQTIIDTIKAERELLGLDAPTKQNISGAVQLVNWDELFTAPPQALDPAEERLRVEEARALPAHQASPAANGNGRK